MAIIMGKLNPTTRAWLRYLAILVTIAGLALLGYGLFEILTRSMP